MTTPADWYPDPEDPTGLRYWDGFRWTEHRTPAIPPPAPAGPPAAQVPASEPATSVAPTDYSSPSTSSPSAPPDESHRGAHRVPDPGDEPVGQSYTPTPSQPYDTHPTTSYETPSYDTPSYDRPSHEAPSYQAPSYETPSYEAPSYEEKPWDAAPAGPPSYASAPPYESSYAPPPGPPGSDEPPTGSSGGGPNKKLAFGIIGAAAAILLAIVVVLVVVLVRKDDPTVTAAPSTSTTTSTTTTETTSATTSEPSATQTTTPPPPGAQGSDGDYSFSIASTETGDTITSTVSDAVQTSAEGMYYVVHLNVANTGTSPLTFVATFQALNAAGQTFPLDDTATAFLGGTTANVDPGATVETALVYDVPVGTEPDSILLRADPSTAGVELPLR